MEDAGFRPYVQATHHRVGQLHGRFDQLNDTLGGAQVEAAQGHRNALRAAVAGAQRALRERPRLRPVPPDADA